MLPHRFLLTFPLLALAVFADAGLCQPPAKDLYGDPLPAGAVARLSTLRFRHADVIAFAAFLPGGKRVVTVGDDGIICVWEFPSGKEISRIEAHPAKERPANQMVKYMNAAALAPDGKTIGTSFMLAKPTEGKGGFGVLGGPLDKPATLPPQEVRLHDLATGTQRSVLKTDTAAVTALAFSPDGKHLSTWCSDRTVRFWDWANAKELRKAETVGSGARISPFSGLLLRAVNKSGPPIYAPDGKTLMLLGATRVLQFVDVATGKEVGPSLGHTVSLTSISFTPDGKQALTHAGNAVHKWDIASTKALGVLKLPPNATRALAISPDGRVGVAEPGLSADQMPGGLAVALFGSSGTVKDAILFDTANGKQLAKIADEFTTDSVVFSPDSKTLAVVGTGAEPKVHLYDVPGGKLLRTSDAIPGAPAVVGKGKRGRANSNTRVLFARDGKALAVHPGPVGAALVVLDTANGKLIGSITPPGDGLAVTLSAFAADGRCLAVDMSDGTVLLNELATGQSRRTFTNKSRPLPGKDDFAEQVLFGAPASPRSRGSTALSPDGRLLALAGADGAVRVLDVLTGKERAAFTGHQGAVNAVAFAPDGKTLASASADMTALIWDVTKIDRPAPLAKAPQPGNLKAWWQALAEQDAAKAFAALGDFVASPKEAATFLKEHLKPAPPLDGKRVDALIQQVDNGQFQVRDQATRELLKLGEPILPALDKALAANPPLETKRRLEELRGKMTSMFLQGERLRAVRAIEVLERMGTPESRQLLQSLAAGAPRALLTNSAQAALKR